MPFNALVECGMGKLPARQYKPLFLAEWIARLGHEQSVVVKQTGVSQGYISNLSGGRRANPSAHILREISEYLGISMNDLYLSPPPESDVAAMGRYSPAAREVLMQARKHRA